MRRSIEAEQAKPRATARWITVITTGFLGLLALTTDFLSPYASAPGQLALAVLLGLFVVGLVWLRALTAGRRLPRFVGHSVSAAGPGAAPGAAASPAAGASAVAGDGAPAGDGALADARHRRGTR